MPNLSTLFDDLEIPLDSIQTRQTPADAQTWTNPCPKCHGTGTYCQFGQCYTCKGSGKLTFKTSPFDRQKPTSYRAEAKARNASNAFESFAAEHPTVAAWIVAEAPRFEFARSMRESVEKFGHLTEKQLAACQRCIERNAQAGAVRAERRDQAQAVDVSKIAEIFANARKAELKRPKLRIGTVELSLAAEHSANAGAVYVKRADVYLGKIMGGRFQPSRVATADDVALVEAAAQNPTALAVAYGKRTGHCACCGRLLTDPESVARGIGPICARQWGL